MKKIFATLLCFLFCFGLCACANMQENNNNLTAVNPNETKYQKATEYLNNKNYTQALMFFEELASEGYKDSAEQVKETKYQFAKERNDSKDETVYEYLQELVAENYKDSAEIYNQLYSWGAEIAFSNYQKTLIHSDVVKASTKTFPFYYINFAIIGGTPGDSFSGQYEIKYSNGKIERAGYGSGGGLTLSLICSATENPIGYTTFTLYDANGNILATRSATIQ